VIEDRDFLHVPNVSIIVPTYREAENLPRLLPRIADALAKAGLAGEVLVVDDDSPDATEAVCRPFVEAGDVRLITRRDERGLASAVLHGIDQARGERVVVMDADLSHPPEAIPAGGAGCRRRPRAGQPVRPWRQHGRRVDDLAMDQL
jgi:dolichol-phosphate mannosyltransferase